VFGIKSGVAIDPDNLLSDRLPEGEIISLVRGDGSHFGPGVCPGFYRSRPVDRHGRGFAVALSDSLRVSEFL